MTGKTRSATAVDASKCRCGHTRLAHPLGRCVITTCTCRWFGPADHASSTHRDPVLRQGW